MSFLASFSLGAFLESTQITRAAAFYLLGGAGLTCLLVFLAMGLGLLLGTVMASFQVYGPAWTARLVSLYVWFFRSIPIIVLMFMFYLGLSSQVDGLILELFGVRASIPAFPVAAAVLGLTSAAYQSQIFRGAMQSIPSGQFRAAKALGMSQVGAIRSVILPQALRISLPAWSNEYSILLKDSAIAFVLGVSETMARINQLAATSHQPLLIYILAGIIYYLLTWAGVKLLMKLYERVRIPGLAEVDHSGF
ncbi:MAG: amino acid ABC transporter permease [Candidatus Adiutrix sp.]|jgi:polar amino acid transport system permease protein|nr:amino acid ABC transporter permease [Candidatus Adiutrix sp.]